jgi:hypothetical protein
MGISVKATTLIDPVDMNFFTRFLGYPSAVDALRGKGAHAALIGKLKGGVLASLIGNLKGGVDAALIGKLEGCALSALIIMLAVFVLVNESIVKNRGAELAHGFMFRV